MHTCSMCLFLFVVHHMLFFSRAGKVVILTPAYSTRVTLLECGFALPASKLLFTCTEGSRWGHSIHIHQPRSATLTLTPAPHPCSLHGLNRSNLGLLQDHKNMFIISMAGKHQEPSPQQSPHHPNSKSALRHQHSQTRVSRMEHLPH